MNIELMNEVLSKLKEEMIMPPGYAQCDVCGKELIVIQRYSDTTKELCLSAEPCPVCSKEQKLKNKKVK